MVGLFAAGAGIALPYSSAPRIGLAALPQTLAGKGSGILNSSSFLGGTVGVTAGGVLFGAFGFTGRAGARCDLRARRRRPCASSARLTSTKHLGTLTQGVRLKHAS